MKRDFNPFNSNSLEIIKRKMEKGFNLFKCNQYKILILNQTSKKICHGPQNIFNI